MNSAAPAADLRIRLVLFDLDGTLVDTADDLAAAVNRCQDARGLPLTPPPELRPWTSHGARGLMVVSIPRWVAPLAPSPSGLRYEKIIPPPWLPCAVR